MENASNITMNRMVRIRGLNHDELILEYHKLLVENNKISKRNKFLESWLTDVKRANINVRGKYIKKSYK